MGFGSFFGSWYDKSKKKYGYNYNKPTNTGVTTKPKPGTKYTFNRPEKPQPDFNTNPEAFPFGKDTVVDAETGKYIHKNDIKPIDQLAPNQIQAPQTVQKPEFTPDQNLQTLATQDTSTPDTDILSTLQQPQQEQVNKNIMDALSGNMFAPQQAANRQAFAAAAQQLRKLGGSQNVGNIGQGGAAYRGAQATEQNIMSQLANQQLQEQQQMADLKLKGTGMAQDLAQKQAAQGFAEKQLKSSEKMQALGMMSNEKLAADSNWLAQQGIDQQNAQLYGYTDQQGNKIKGLIETNQEKWGLDKQKYAASLSVIVVCPKASNAEATVITASPASVLIPIAIFCPR
jgi:hypothetical protein